jgi:hypothetical protein
MSATIYDVNNTWECCYTVATGYWQPCQNYSSLLGVVNVSQQYRLLCCWGLGLIGLTILTKIIARSQRNNFKNGGKHSKCIIFMLFMELLAWWSWTIAATVVTGDQAGRGCFDRGKSIYSSQWVKMRCMIWVLWFVLVIFTMTCGFICKKGRNNEPLMQNPAPMRQPQVTVIQTQPVMPSQVQVVQAQPAYGYGQAQPAYGYGQAQPAYGYGQAQPAYNYGQAQPAYGYGQAQPAYGYGQPMQQF